ncbi:hypothetical protein [uncultured Flavobacterium sp.]|uniref:hypothetical protein n=1 Tax=uncultured Flavobacterium sp. TaxID=165435 RepID=UPI0030CA363C|tara:strand:- start:1579 stop:2283 length:705 start_codon:yes stop_codon:yes gene_type:complete
MKLNNQQIQRLYQFTRQHYVEWYDLQTELVDHLANAIEEQWLHNPKQNFEEALQIEFKKFGVFGFMDVVEKRQAALGKKYNKIIWSHLKDFFTIPKIILTLSMVLGLFYFFKLYFFNEFIAYFIITLYIMLMPIIIYEHKKKKKRKSKTGKIWLFEEIISGYGTMSIILTLPAHMFTTINSFSGDMPNDYFLFGFSLFIVTFLLVTYIVVKIIPSKAEKYLKETYPEYELANTV